MFSRAIIRKYSAPYISVILPAVGITLIAIYILDHDISYKAIIVSLVALAGFWVFAAGNRGLKVGLVFLVGTFGLGYRTMNVTPELKVHPSELVLWGLLVLPLLQRNISARTKLIIPPWIILFIPFWLLGWWPLFSGQGDWELMFSEFKNFIILIPLFLLASIVLAEESSWRPVLLAFYLVGTWIAAMGILEYTFPQIQSILPGFVGDPMPNGSPEGFQRAAFSFWGSADAVYICVLAVPIGTAVWEWWSAPWARALNALVMATMLGGIYISGHRNSWFMAIIQLVGFLVIKRHYLVGVGVLFALLLAFPLLPDATRERIDSGAELVSGQPLKRDTSGTKRWYRVSNSLTNSLEQPLGRGWAAAGWVHNDFLQVAENLGLLAGGLFFGAFILTLQRLWRRVRAASQLGEQRILGTALLLSFTCAGIILATEAALSLPQQILPIWFIWVTVEVWLRQTRMKKVTIDETSFNLGAVANLQLCSDRSRYSRSRQMGR